MDGEFADTIVGGDEATVLKLLNEGAIGSLNLTFESEGIEDYTPLMLAAESGHERIVSLMLERHVPTRPQLTNSMMFAVCNGHEQVVDMLLKHGARVNEVGTFFRAEQDSARAPETPQCQSQARRPVARGRGRKPPDRNRKKNLRVSHTHDSVCECEYTHTHTHTHARFTRQTRRRQTTVSLEAIVLA